MSAVEQRVRTAVEAVTDPEIPVLTIADLGILRGIRVDGARVEVDITPTYSGCPALEVIREDVAAAVRATGVPDVVVRTVLAPAWTTDWMSAEGRRKLHDHGIAPPPATGLRPLPVVECPQCGSADTEEVSRFASTPCQALHRCVDCLEPFNHFKAH